ncbi:reverse transcriptase [Senna tora]|uniref:Reverse transcriptase n=1 Tax=Senna tora TaxID=362788 RepID=A0A834W7R8_9FABA|nr:reverse transcriptase [Senna tora]
MAEDGVYGWDLGGVMAGFLPNLTADEVISLVWVKIQNLPIEYFNQVIHYRIGNALGTFIGMDESTHNLAAARFASYGLKAGF